MLKLLLVLHTLFLHVLDIDRAMAVQIHRTLLFLLLILLVNLHRVFIIHIVFGFGSSQDKILERMLTDAPQIVGIKVLGHTVYRLPGTFLL